jgi:oligopeptide/dipeptide ABC transporter ATP-binding protein
MNKLLSVQDLKTYFYTSTSIVKAVDNITFEVESNETVGLVGESGCGKSTAALSVPRLIASPPGKILQGKIAFKERSLLDLPEREMKKIRGKEISMIFQDPMTFLNPVMKIGQQIQETILAHQPGDVKNVKTNVIEALEMVQIPSPRNVAEMYPHELSGGMRQRALIAMAISCQPDLVIADEPTTALDVTVQAQILSLFERLRDEFSSSLFLITHDLGVVSEICDRVYIMYAGKIVESGDVISIYEAPAHPYTTGLLKSALSIDQFKKTLVTIEGTVPDLINPPMGCRFHPRCPFVKPICKQQEPRLTQTEPEHLVSCWLYE